MVRVIGNKGCVNCEITKQILKKKGVKFSYELFSELSEYEQNKLNKLAISKGLMKMPLILKNNELITIVEL